MHITRKAKNTPAHQRKFPLAPPSPCASAFAARSVKGRCAFHSATLHCTLDFTARLRPARHTMAAPGEISFPDRRKKKAGNSRKASMQLPSSALSSAVPHFSGTSSPLSVGGSGTCRVSEMRLPPSSSLLPRIGASACPNHANCLSQARLFVPRHPGGPAYGTCTRAAALYSFRLARGFAPSNPARPSEGSGSGKGKRR